MFASYYPIRWIAKFLFETTLAFYLFTCLNHLKSPINILSGLQLILCCLVHYTYMTYWVRFVHPARYIWLKKISIKFLDKCQGSNTHHKTAMCRNYKNMYVRDWSTDNGLKWLFDFIIKPPAKQVKSS